MGDSQGFRISLIKERVSACCLQGLEEIKYKNKSPNCPNKSSAAWQPDGQIAILPSTRWQASVHLIWYEMLSKMYDLIIR